MKTSEIAKLLEGAWAQGEFEDREIAGAYTSDLLSDAMGKAVPEGVLITIQAHKNTVAVASLKDLCAIIICGNRPVPDDMIAAARSEGIGIFVTPNSQFEASGLLYPVLGGSNAARA